MRGNFKQGIAETFTEIIHSAQSTIGSFLRNFSKGDFDFKDDECIWKPGDLKIVGLEKYLLKMKKIVSGSINLFERRIGREQTIL